MYIYRLVDRFDSKTGKPIQGKEFYQIRSDWSGIPLEGVDDNGEEIWPPMTYGSFTLNYGDNDACCGSGGEEFKFGEKYGINMHSFLLEQYDFCSCDANNDHEFEGFAKAFLKSGMDLPSFFRKIRIATAKKLIKSGVIKPEQLYFDK